MSKLLNAVERVKHIALDHPKICAAAAITIATVVAPVATTSVVAVRGMIALIDDAERMVLLRNLLNRRV